MFNHENYNNRKINVELRRIDICDLILACSMCSDLSDNVEKWSILHDKLSDILDIYDKDNFDLFYTED